MLDPNRN